jgi:hypothetical protein
MENIIVETHREFILQNRGKTAGQSGAYGPLARNVSSVLTLIWRCFTVKYEKFIVFGAIYLLLYFILIRLQNV